MWLFYFVFLFAQGTNLKIKVGRYKRGKWMVGGGGGVKLRVVFLIERSGIRDTLRITIFVFVLAGLLVLL